MWGYKKGDTKRYLVEGEGDNGVSADQRGPGSRLKVFKVHFPCEKGGAKGG